MSRDLLKKNPSVGLPVSVLGWPGARNDQPSRVGYRTTAKHALKTDRASPLCRHNRGACPYVCEPPCLSGGQTHRDGGRRDGADHLDRRRAIGAGAAAPEGTPAAWRVECAGDGKTLDCRAVQQVFHRETRQLVVSALVRPAADAKTGAMVITLPLGLNLTEPVLVKVDNGTAERQSIQTCTNVGCFVAMTLTD